MCGILTPVRSSMIAVDGMTDFIGLTFWMPVLDIGCIRQEDGADWVCAPSAEKLTLSAVFYIPAGKTK